VLIVAERSEAAISTRCGRRRAKPNDVRVFLLRPSTEVKDREAHLGFQVRIAAPPRTRERSTPSRPFCQCRFGGSTLSPSERANPIALLAEIRSLLRLGRSVAPTSCQCDGPRRGGLSASHAKACGKSESRTVTDFVLDWQNVSVETMPAEPNLAVFPRIPN